MRERLAERGNEAVIPPNPTRKHAHRYDLGTYKQRKPIERMFWRLEDFRRSATRYENRAGFFLSTILLVAVVT